MNKPRAEFPKANNAAEAELFALLEEGYRSFEAGRAVPAEDVMREMREYIAGADAIAV